MPMKLRRLDNGRILPVVDGVICQSCGHEIPNSANSAPEVHVQFVPGRAGETVALHRPDILYWTQLVYDAASKSLVPEHLVTLASADNAAPHLMPLLGHYLRDKARTEAGRAELAQYGIMVVSTHDEDGEPGNGHEMTNAEKKTLLSRTLNAITEEAQG